MGWRRRAVILAALLASAPAVAQPLLAQSLLAQSLLAQSAPEYRLPVLVPLTGLAAREGASQRNGALLAVSQIGDIAFKPEVLDTAETPDAAIAAWTRTMDNAIDPPAVIGPIVSAQMQALLPLAQERDVPLITVSGGAHLTGVNNRHLFRFFPTEGMQKVAHALYVAEKLHAKRPAVIYQATAYGEAGREHLARHFTVLKTPPVLEESVPPTVDDLTAVLQRAKAANADVLVLHLHAPSTVLAVRQARQILPGVPVVAGAALHQPATAALLEPAELKGVCAETASSPVSVATRPLRDFLGNYRAAYQADPDAFAAAQYDAVFMLRQAIVKLRASHQPVSPAAVRDRLASDDWRGVAADYRSDGRGNMAHEAEIVCYDGASRVPVVSSRYSFPVR